MNYGQVSYSQEGEDILLSRMIGNDYRPPGTYVDVGCNHPWQYSNTAHFYEQGWHGVAIDPNPDFAKLFAETRPRDVFLNLGVSDREGRLLYHVFEESAYNTFSLEKARQLVHHTGKAEPVTQEIAVTTLPDALGQVWPDGQEIDILSIDAEGLDMKIIAGHDFDRFPVRFLCIELENVFLRSGRDETTTSITDAGFVAVAKLFKSAMFVRRDVACATWLEGRALR